MIKMYCDLCRAEMDNWNKGFTVDFTDGEAESVQVTGVIQASKHTVFHQSKHIARHVAERHIDICKACFVKVFTKGTDITIYNYPPVV